MQKPLILFLFIFISFFIEAQTVDLIKADHTNYIWGEGSGTTLKAADQQALADIISQISTQVESKFERTIEETGNKFTETVNDVLKTYSNATLNNTGRFIIQNEPDAVVFRYVKRSEIDKVFESRKQKILEFAANGEQYLAKYQIADALRYFYWSQTLLRSYPDGASIKYNTSEGKEVSLLTWLPNQINAIFANISVVIDKVENKNSFYEYLLHITYKNHPVKNLDYSYWAGQDWTNIHSAKDGLGVAELSANNKVDELKMKLEYAFEGESAIDMELRDVMQVLSQVPYKNAYLNVTQVRADSSSSYTSSPSSTVSYTASSSQTGNLGTVTTLTDFAHQESVLQKVITGINTKQYASIKNLFTSEGYDVFLKLMQYGNAKILRTNTIKYYQYDDYVMCRSIPMSFSFQNNNRTFVEDVVFTIDKKNKISNITFGLSKESVDDIAANDQWSEHTRMLLIDFMETYKTAYALKRLDYIESIFSDDALIITGSVVKVRPNAELKYQNNQIVKYNKQSKEQYLRNLQHCFRSNEFINIRFADNTVRQSGKGNEVYGIQIKQDYFSTNYGDTGYLFLLIDLTDSISPTIHVRTWQPEKHPDGSIYGLTDF